MSMMSDLQIDIDNERGMYQTTCTLCDLIYIIPHFKTIEHMLH